MATSEQVSEGPIWRMVLGLGIVLAIVGVLELAALWFPPDFAVPAWRFSTSIAFLDRFPMLLLGAVMVLAGAVALGYRLTARTLAVVSGLLAVCVILAATLYATVVSDALGVSPDGTIREHIVETSVKAGLQALLYPGALILVAVLSWRGTSTRGRA